MYLKILWNNLSGRVFNLLVDNLSIIDVLNNSELCGYFWLILCKVRYNVYDVIFGGFVDKLEYLFFIGFLVCFMIVVFFIK